MELYNAIAKLDKGGDASEPLEVSLCLKFGFLFHGVA